jgi:multidrug resistance efflux pump
VSDLLTALEASRPQIEAALAEAERELAELQAREQQLRTLITRAKAALGEQPPVATVPIQRLTLHEAIRQVLLDHPEDWMTVTDIAVEINRRKLYEKRDSSPVEPSQIHARTKNYAALFDKDGPRIRLREQPRPQ